MTRKSTESGETEILTTDADGRATIRLPAQGTTGYRWQLKGNPVELEGHEIEPGASFGAGGHETFHVKLKGASPVEIEIVLKRPWEQEPRSVRRLVISPARSAEDSSDLPD
jgi:predicted secreted protein